MLELEDWMDIRSLHQQGLSVSEIARRAGIDRKTVRKYLREAPREYQRKPKAWKIDPFRAYLRERWEQGVENASRLFGELQKKGYAGCVTPVRNVVQPWRAEGRERAFVRFETSPGEHYGKFRVMVRNGGDPRILEEDLRHDLIFLQHNSLTGIRASSGDSMIAAALVAVLDVDRLPTRESFASSQDRLVRRFRWTSSPHVPGSL